MLRQESERLLGDEEEDDLLDHTMLSYKHAISKNYLYNTLQSIMPYQSPLAHMQIHRAVVYETLEHPGTVTTLLIMGPHNSGKSMTGHALIWGLAIQTAQIVVISTLQLVKQESDVWHELMGTRQDRPKELSLAQKLIDASVGDPPLIILIVDDVNLAPHIIPCLYSLLRNGLLVTLNGAYFKLSEKTSLLVVFTSDAYVDPLVKTAHLVVYSPPLYERSVSTNIVI